MKRTSRHEELAYSETETEQTQVWPILNKIDEIIRQTVGDDAVLSALQLILLRQSLKGWCSAAAAMSVECENVEYFVPLSKHPMLNRQFETIAARNPALLALSERFRERGVTRVGHVVQLSRAEVLEFANGAESALLALEARLAQFDLGLGRKTPRWSA